MRRGSTQQPAVLAGCFLGGQFVVVARFGIGLVVAAAC